MGQAGPRRTQGVLKTIFHAITYPGFSRRCRYALPELPVLSAGRKTDPDAKGNLAFAQLPKLVKTPRHALHAAAGNTADAGDGNDSDSSYDDDDSWNNDSDAPLADDE